MAELDESRQSGRADTYLLHNLLQNIHREVEQSKGALPFCDGGPFLLLVLEKVRYLGLGIEASPLDLLKGLAVRARHLVVRAHVCRF